MEIFLNSREQGCCQLQEKTAVSPPQSEASITLKLSSVETASNHHGHNNIDLRFVCDIYCIELKETGQELTVLLTNYI